MKKLFVGIAATALAAVMCVGLVGCGTKSAADLKSQQFSDETFEADWKAAFAEENFKNYVLTVSTVMEAKEGEEWGKQTTTMTITVNEGKEKIVGTVKYEGAAIEKDEDGNDIKEETEEMYVDTVNGVYYSKNDDGEWETTTSGMSSESIIGTYMMLGDYGSAFEYNADKKGYTLKTEDTGLPSFILSYLEGIVFKFKDNKIAGVYMEMNDQEEGSEDYMKVVYDMVFDYTTKTVTLPTVAE